MKQSVKVKALISFFDVESNISRKKGEEFETTLNRVEQINSIGQSKIKKDLVQLLEVVNVNDIPVKEPENVKPEKGKKMNNQHQQKIKQLEQLLQKEQNPDLKKSIKQKINALKGNKTIEK